MDMKAERCFGVTYINRIAKMRPDGTYMPLHVSVVSSEPLRILVNHAQLFTSKFPNENFAQDFLLPHGETYRVDSHGQILAWDENIEHYSQESKARSTK